MDELLVMWQCGKMKCEHHGHYVVQFYVRPGLTIPVIMYDEKVSREDSAVVMLGIMHEALEYANMVMVKYGAKLRAMGVL